MTVDRLSAPSVSTAAQDRRLSEQNPTFMAIPSRRVLRLTGGRVNPSCSISASRPMISGPNAFLHLYHAGHHYEASGLVTMKQIVSGVESRLNVLFLAVWLRNTTDAAIAQRARYHLGLKVSNQFINSNREEARSSGLASPNV